MTLFCRYDCIITNEVRGGSSIYYIYYQGSVIQNYQNQKNCRTLKEFSFKRISVQLLYPQLLILYNCFIIIISTKF